MKMSTPNEKVSTRLKNLKSAIEEVSTRLEDLKSTTEGVSNRVEDLKSTIEEVSTHQKDLKYAIEEISTLLKESNPPLKMSTPTEEVYGEKEVSTDLTSTIQKFSTHLKKSSYEDWILIVTNLVDCVDHRFPSTTEQNISDIKRQIFSCIEVLDSVPPEKRESIDDRSMFEYLKGRFYNMIPDVYEEKAEEHLENAIQLNPFLVKAWDCLGQCVSKKGHNHRAKNCYKFVLKMGGENAEILRRIATLEYKHSLVSKHSATHLRQCIKYARKTLDLDRMDGGCAYTLGCAYFNLFLLSGGRHYIQLQPALEAFQYAKKIVAQKSIPNLEYKCSMVDRYLENYKMSLKGFSDSISTDPMSDGSHQMRLTLQLLDRVKRLLQGKHNDKNKGKSKKKSTETSLHAQIQSLANIDVNPLYNRATVDLLHDGLNKQIEVVATVRCLVKYDYRAPLYYMLCDSDGNSFVLTVFGIQKEAIKPGDQVTLLDPICKFVDFEWGGKHYQFKSVRVYLVKGIVVNGNPLRSNYSSLLDAGHN